MTGAPHPTVCRICESACGLVAEVADGRVVALRPDPDDPVSRGYACRKGTTFHERVAHHPDRLVAARVDGRSVPRDAAIAEAGRRLAAARRRSGPTSIGVYSGNAVGHSFGAVLAVEALRGAFGTRRHYSCLTLDNSEVFVVADRVFGNPLATFVADYAGADLVVLFGTDPLGSQASAAQSHPRATADLRDVARRGQLVVVDPRRSVTAAQASVHLQPRVGADLFALAWLVGGATSDPALRAACAPYDLDRVARVTGVTGARWVALRDALHAAERPLVWTGLGVLLGPHGTLGWWLTVALQHALGGL
ncbi:MAG: hypothetical protein ABMB14_32715, partial [Myxococcota bacterium]